MNSALVITDAASVFLVLEDQELSTTLLLEVKTAPVLEVLNAGIQGPRGTAGSGGQPTRIDFTNSATWIGSHGLGRVPLILVYLSDGRPILADVTATDINFTVVHASAQSGFVLFY